MTPDLTNPAYRGYCDECGTELEYLGNTTTSRGEIGGEFECPECDETVIRR